MAQNPCYKYRLAPGFAGATDTPQVILEKIDTAHDYWRAERGDLIQDVLFRIYDPEKYVQVQGGYNKSLSGQFEPELESFFDVNYGYPSLCESQKYGKVYWTIYELMADYGVGGTGPQDFLNTIVPNPMIKAIQLQIPTGSEKRTLFNDPAKSSELNYVANCIIQFYALKPLTDQELSLVAIDANSGALPCIFQNFRQNINTSANALTICDSASGGVEESGSSKCGKSNFTRKYQPLLFPFNMEYVIAAEDAAQKAATTAAQVQAHASRLATLNEIKTQYKDSTEIGRAYVMQSNFFTRLTHVLYYTEKKDSMGKSVPFSVSNPCSIVFHVKVIQADGKGKDYSAPFGYTSTGKVQSGTPVPVLRELIRTIEDLWTNRARLITELTRIGNESDRFNIVPVILAMINDGVSRDTIIKVLLDYKRGGDHEQINAMKETKNKTGCTLQFLATGDNLCKTKANQEGENSSYTHGDKLDLCRFPSDTLTPVQIAAQKIAIANAETTRLKLALTARIAQIQGITITTLELQTYKTELDTWMLQYDEQPLTLLTLKGLQYKIDTYLAPGITQVPGVPPGLFESYIDKIQAVDAATDQKVLLDLNDELRLFYDNVDTMSRVGYDMPKNQLGPATAILAPGTPAPGTPRSSPNSISNKFRKAPFFGIDLTPNVELIKIVETMIAFNNSNERRRGNKVMKANIEETILRFQELTLQILDNYKSNMSISILPPSTQDDQDALIKKIEEIEERVKSFRLSDSLFDKTMDDDLIIYNIVDDSAMDPLTKKSIQFDDEDPIQKLLGPLHETETEGDVYDISDDESVDMGAQGADDDDTGAQDADGMDMGATTMGVATMGAATMDANTMGATMDATMRPAYLSTGKEQQDFIERRSLRNQGLPAPSTGTGTDTGTDTDTDRKKSRRGGGITQPECDDITNMNINEAMIVGSDEVIPFITSVVSEYDPVYYYQAIEKQEDYLNKIYDDAMNKTLEGQWDKKLSIQQSIIDGFDKSIVAAAAAAGPITIDYNKFITYLTTTIDKIAIENVYAGLSVGFNAYMYSYLQDKCDASTMNMTILEALDCLPNAMKLLIFITNLVEDETGLFFYGEKYGNQEEVSDVIFKLHTPTASPGPIADISNTIDYIYTLDDLHEVYCYVIQFFGIAKKYFIDRSDAEELAITEYFSVSKESNTLIAAAVTRNVDANLATKKAEKATKRAEAAEEGNDMTNADKAKANAATYRRRASIINIGILNIIISNFLVAVMKEKVTGSDFLPTHDPITMGKKRLSRGGGSKTRRKKRPSKKRNMKTKRSNANTKKNKKRNSRKLKKRNRKKRTTRRKK